MGSRLPAPADALTRAAVEPRGGSRSLGAVLASSLVLVGLVGSAMAQPAPAGPPTRSAGAGGKPGADGGADAGPSDAVDHVAEGMAAFGEKAYERAIAAFETAYRLDPQPEVLYALAQAERLSGDCPTAIALYRRFLASGPAERHAEVARDGLERCERALASRPLDARPARAPVRPAAAPATRAARAPVPRPTTAPVEGPAPSRLRDPVGGVLLGAGLVGLAVGGALFAASSASVADADTAPTYDGYVHHMDRAQSRRTWALVGLGAGTGLVAAAALRYLSLEPRGSTTATLTVAMEPDGVGLVAVGRF